MLLSQFAIGQSQSKVTDHAMDDLHEQELSVRQVSTYEEQAMLKLKDILDYTAIIGSAKYNESMRAAALESVVSYFDAKARVICDWIEIGWDTGPAKMRKEGEHPKCSPQKILERLAQTNNFEIEAVYQKMQISKKAIKQADGSYKGQITFELQYKTTASQNSKGVEQMKSLSIMDFELRRIKKKFGKEKELVWEIQFLGVE